MEKTMSLEEVSKFRRSQKDIRERRRSAVWGAELSKQHKDIEEALRTEADAQVVVNQEAGDQEKPRHLVAETRKMQSALISLRQDHGYSLLWGFVDAFVGSSDQQVSAQASWFVKSHTAGLVDHLQAWNPGGVAEVSVDVVNGVLAREGNTLTTLLARHELGSVMRVLEMFSMDDLKTQLQEHAPVLLGLLCNVVLTQTKRDRMMGGVDPRRDHEMVLTMSCMSGCLLIMGTGAGNSAKKGLIKTLAHAGLSLSYNSIVNKVRILSAEGLKQLVRVSHEQMWPSKGWSLWITLTRNHRDTHFIVQTMYWGSSASRNAATLPEGTKGWSAHYDEEEMGSAPVVLQIPLHKTEQYPLPAMKIDESSIEGTIEVLNTILTKVLKMSVDDLREHGLLFVDGDLLTILLTDKVESGQQDDTDFMEAFQGMMIINQHWGTLNTKWAGCLWMENLIAGRKAVTAGWKAKKFPLWKTSHELLHISAAAHICDKLCVEAGVSNFNEWADGATMEEFNAMAILMAARGRPATQWDHAFENTLLYNRDILPYLELCDAIKTGDIGRVVNVFWVWMVMMRGENRMPKYVDVMFETLGNLETFPDDLRWRGVSAQLVGQSVWEALGVERGGFAAGTPELLGEVCIFVLCDAMRTIHTSFGTAQGGTCHTDPKMEAEVKSITEYLVAERLHTWVLNREGNEDIAEVTDLLSSGSSYPHTPCAFKNFLIDRRQARYDHSGSVGVGSSGSSEEGEDEPLEQYESTRADLAMDSEESLEWSETMLQAAISLIESLGV
ncbi:hypothetical protein K439DRAFT_1620110 [Ramaria rubella]|nr:hypothetical protein K439DRAFT_1620110 [Ramaria rubella]